MRGEYLAQVKVTVLEVRCRSSVRRQYTRVHGSSGLTVPLLALQLPLASVMEACS